MVREIPESMDKDAVARIDARLAAICKDHAVAMPLAVESGSRAWGFPSPDSDYDCRFIFVRRREDYLSLWPFRDVIETPLEGVLDVNGWDLAKALKLLLKGNAVVVEWLTSPIVYAGDFWFRQKFMALAEKHLNRNLVARHYLHLGLRQRRAYFRDGEPFPLKKLFYALRPAAALRWLRLHPDKAVAPMHFPTLLAECDAPPSVRELAADLIVRKSVTRELGTGEMPFDIAAFIDHEFEVVATCFDQSPIPVSVGARLDVQAFFLEALAAHGKLSALKMDRD